MREVLKKYFWTETKTVTLIYSYYSFLFFVFFLQSEDLGQELDHVSKIKMQTIFNILNVRQQNIQNTVVPIVFAADGKLSGPT